MAAVGAAPSANGASISGVTLTLQPYDATHPGLSTTGSQTAAGDKTFTGDMIFNGDSKVLNLSKTNATDPAIPRLKIRTDSDFGFDIHLRDDVDGDLLIKRVVSGTPTIAMSIARADSTITIPGYLSCTALTTNGSGLMGCTASDERLKRDIVPFERGLEALNLKPKSFKFKDPGDLGIEHSGFIAQDVEKLIPEAVRIGPNGMRTVDYWTIIAVQTNAINELRARLEALEGPRINSKKAIPMKPIWKARPQIIIDAPNAPEKIRRKRGWNR